MSIRILYAYLVFLFFMYSCVNKYQGQKLAVLTINSKMKNSKIVDRIPDYGFSGRDGCIGLSEMRLDLNLRKQSSISGLVTNVSNKEPIGSASIRVLTVTGRVLTLASDDEGKFILNVNETISRLEIAYIDIGRSSLTFNSRQSFLTAYVWWYQ